MEEAKEKKCYKRIIFKQFVLVSGLCGPQFLSYLPKRFTHLCRAFVWRRHIGAQFWCTNMAAENQQKHLEYTFSTKPPSFHSRTSIRAHTNYLNGYTAENQENQPSFQNVLQISIPSNI